MDKILLLVDDEPSILHSLQRVFHRTDYEVLTADCGEKALDIIKEKPISVLVSDYNMPGLVGADLLAKAKTLRPEMSRIILSGNSDQESVIRSLNEGGALKFLTKPWDTQTLIQEVDAAYRAWVERCYSQDSFGLLSQANLVEEIQQLLNEPDGQTFAVVGLQIRDINSIRQRLRIQEEREFLKHYLSSQNLDSLQNTISGLMDDGRFCVLIPIDGTAENGKKEVASLIKALMSNFEYKENRFQILFDVGYTLSNGSDAAEELMRNAFIALNRAVQSGDDRFVVFESEMHAATLRRFSVSEHLHTALPNDEFLLYYQPKIKTSSQTLHGAEALIRWNSEHLGIVSPFDFIPLAEESDLINDIGQWVMKTAAAQWHKWFHSQSTEACVSVNVSSRQLRDKNFVKRVAKVLDSTGIAPASFELEITESMMMQNIDQALAMLSEIKQLGVKLSIDDFGTGYSSLNYLHKLPLDVIKIDRSFILPLVERKESQSLVKNLIAMGQDLNMAIVAEGVETDAQLDMLLEFGCDVIQGYYYSPPVPVSEFAALMVTYPVLATPKTHSMEMEQRKAG